MTEEGEDTDPTESCAINYKDPSFILQNIAYNHHFEIHPNFSMTARTNMIECMCDQICYYVMCVYRAHHLAASAATDSFEDRLKIKPPGMLVYGSGVVAECVLDALADVGCAPYIKVFSRDKISAKEWARKGFRSTLEMKDGYEIDILLICSNICSFAQMCRDLSQFLTSKTFIISNVFCLQRQRMYNLFGTPGIVRTYVERKGSSRLPKGRSELTRATSARHLASKANGVKNLILILENYMIALNIQKDTARREAMHLVVGSQRISMDEKRMSSPYKSMRHINFSDEEITSSDSETSSNNSSFSKKSGDDEQSEDKDVELDSLETLFLIRARSFQAEGEAGEDEHELMEKQKRKLRKQKQKRFTMLRKQKYARDVQNGIANTEFSDSDDEDVPNSATGANKDVNSTLSISTEKNSSRNAIERTESSENTSHLSPSHMGSPNSRNNVSSTSSPRTIRESNAISSPSSRRGSELHVVLAEDSKSPGKGNVIGGFKPKVVNRKRLSISQRGDGGKGFSSHSPGKPDDKENKQMQDNDRRDKMLGITTDKREVGYLHEVVSAIAVERNIESTIKQSPLLQIIRDIDKRYGEIFRQELAKHILVIDLPSLADVKQEIRRRCKKSKIGSALAKRAAMARKKMLYSVMPTVEKKHVGYLNAEDLLTIFNSDRKNSGLTAESSPLLEEMNDLSDDEDKEGEGDDLFLEDVPREKFRYFVIE